MNRRTIRYAAAVAALTAFVVLAGGLLNTNAAARTACASLDLGAYTSQPHATEKGALRRCRLLQQIHNGGAPVPGALYGRVLDELSNRFAVEIVFEGEVGLPGDVIDYLLDNMPESAVLVSAYSANEYRATQLDTGRGPRYFYVTNSESFAASFTYLYARSSPDTSSYMFFENGHARVLFWRVWGNSFVRYDLQKQGQNTSRYAITVHVFTSSRLLRTILKSGVFRYFAASMFDDILNDIESAVHEFAGDPDPDDNLPPYFVDGLRDRLKQAVETGLAGQ